MPFDAKFKELARATDSIDRLREVQRRLERARVQKERRHDLLVRATLILLLGLVLSYALSRL